MARKDIIRWVIDRMMAHEDSITQELALRVELEARAEWGGQRIEYIAKTMDRRAGPAPKLALEAEAQAYRQMLTTEKPMQELASEHGVSRRTMYNLIKRGPRNQ